MGEACVTKRIAAPASAVWDYLSWFGVKRLEGGTLFHRMDFEGDEVTPGAVRILHLHDGLPVRERLEFHHPADLAYSYRVIDLGDLPVIDYVGHLRVTPAGPSACHVKINSTYSAVGIADEDWRTLWETMEHRLLDDLRERVEAR